jgi:hypothetical protein
MNFITFGTNNYKKQIDRITKEASTFRCFNTITGIYPDMLEESFLEKHKSFMENNNRGYGFWIWKPQAVLQSLKNIPDGEILIYADSGCSMNRFGIDRLNEYVKKAKYISKTGIVCFQMTNHMEEQWTKSKLFDILECEKYKKTPQIHATAFIIKKCPESLKLVQEWSNYSQIYECIDESGESPHPFIDFRHDQSIWSLLNKKYNSLIIETDETSVPQQNMPIWGTRIRGSNNTPYPYLSNTIVNNHNARFGRIISV